MIKIIVSELPKRKQDCPFFRNFPTWKCSITGQGCDCEVCDKLQEERIPLSEMTFGM